MHIGWYRLVMSNAKGPIRIPLTLRSRGPVAISPAAMATRVAMVTSLLVVFTLQLLCISVQSAAGQQDGQHHFVTAYYDMGMWRHTREDYVQGFALAARYLVDRGYRLTLYCIGARGDPTYNCSDFVNTFPHPSVRVRHMTLHQVVTYTQGHSDGGGIVNMRRALEQMLRDPIIHGRPQDSDMLKPPVDSMQYYVLIHQAKFAVLNIEARLMQARKCIDGSCLIWMDVRGVGVGAARWPVDTQLTIRRTHTAAFTATTTNPSNWPSRHTTIYLHGARNEVAACVMVFDAQWYRKTFFPEYREELRRVMHDGEITTDQGMLTLLVQTFPKITLLQPSYDRMAQRLLLEGDDPCSPPACRSAPAA